MEKKINTTAERDLNVVQDFSIDNAFVFEVQRDYFSVKFTLKQDCSIYAK